MKKIMLGLIAGVVLTTGVFVAVSSMDCSKS